ncbi:Polysaccharide pyruvyl transferase [Butyrivibrio sp. ob235]|uniref:polysaccharide pyruvyl transferase family protein n=1 Tax=Butyrivibrio sp. ob235 TaxID=1761780 RepID=UPI0008BCA1D6|nr:polysaccharide pyruvyl transferase family protein [Butyrivibrio sp. ob235]SEL72638.1 Polysaccharide pyruvyl transferase [Butyrivibrio sp. ob235]
MKIGILTHQYINNYGAFLQAYALHQAVSKLFPDDQVEIIDYVNIKHFIINTGGWFRFYKNYENFACWMQKIKLPGTFAKARNTHMVLSKTVYNAKQINALNYDCIIVGSDEVWNFKDSKGNAKLKFGEGLNCKNLIAYAPSVGKTSPDDMLPDYVVNGIKRFKALSARDDLTFELAKKITGKEPTRVLDPTFLGTFPETNLPVKKKPYIMFYYCEKLPVEIHDQIFEYAKAHNLAVYGAGECDKRYTEISVNLTPFEWVEMFRNAEYVFTGTFHGAVFSILNRRQFKVYLTNESRIKKVGALLSELEIPNRKIGMDYIFDLELQKEEIDYDKVFQLIDLKRKQSREYLKTAVEK